ncbi:uncharacterized protein B0H64DRAFT_188735 [Chaetomium fimeti]|uniref:Uncharacterized protein n=1 Tax=Chaetomium fimeti TaxID=1854472 RepID=A0AAE0HDK1_9PEZI|nr:hypothetical protein B0H64DRAFT_188735 [Chaetomium fimeti]
MMTSLGRIANSAVSLTNENTLALVNINLDFSLFRCKPAQEFLPVGSALTIRRREEAETGPTHRTACKLGFLFHEVIPDTPKLIKAFGRRVSEILSRPGINPQGTEKDGPFKPFVGADCTSVWAAATSGSSSIGVLLLACMLADAWDAKTATSIWVEIIEERKKKIRADADASKLVNPHTSTAAQQEYTRAELASWDASVRAWLRRAGASMKVQRTQFAIIAQNLTIPYPRATCTYDTVTLTWTRAMEVLEKLLDNLPQAACDRAVIRGISAWHLYPDLLVFQEEATKVSFRDPLFQASAILSLGLEYKGQPSDNFIRWSLALSHLRYYGNPVPVRSNEQLSRVHMSQLWLVALGAIFCKWQVPYTKFDDALRWFEELGKKLHQTTRSRAELSWLSHLCAAATGLDGERRKTATMLVKYGWRRGANFLGGNIAPDVKLAFFGLCNENVMDALSQETHVDSGIQYLRGIASALLINAEDAVISYEGEIAGLKYSEWASIRPISEHLAERRGTANCLNNGRPTNQRYARWLHCETTGIPGHNIKLEMELQERWVKVESSGEICKVVTEEENLLHVPAGAKKELMWNKPPNLFAGPVGFKHLFGPWGLSNKTYGLWIRGNKYADCVRYLDSRLKAHFERPPFLERGLEWLQGMNCADNVVEYLSAMMKPSPVSTRLPWSEQFSTKLPQRGTKRKRHASPQAPSSKRAEERAMTDFENDHGVDDEVDHEPADCFFMMNFAFRPPIAWLLSLRALELANEVYDRLPSATVSIQVTEQELIKAHWLPLSIQDALRAESNADAYLTACIPASQHLKSMGRAQSFACVAMFESGRFNIDPAKLNEVIALCSEDSIFVSEILLSDPSMDAEKLSIRHIIGNVGVPGMVCMVSPTEPRIRSLGHDASLVSHAPYDGPLTEKFRGTSLHLSFTTWKIPLDWDSTGDIDQEIHLIESVVSVQDQGKWVADIDVLGVETDGLDIISFSCECESEPSSYAQNVVSISSWEEFLDQPPCIGILQTKKNWAARLAAASILIQQGNGHTAAILKGGKLCWNCLREAYEDPEPHLPQTIIL